MNDQMHLSGKRIYLRKVRKSDINENYLSWIKDPVVTRFMDSGSMSSNKQDIMAYYSNFKNNKKDFLFAIVVKEGEKHIGNVRLGPIEEKHRRSEFGIMIGDRKVWGQGFAFEAIKLVLKYAFEKLRLNRVNIYVVEISKPAVAVYKKAGFQVEGRVRKNFCLKGKYLNTLVMGMLKEDFKKIKKSGIWTE